MEMKEIKYLQLFLLNMNWYIPCVVQNNRRIDGLGDSHKTRRLEFVNLLLAPFLPTPELTKIFLDKKSNLTPAQPVCSSDPPCIQGQTGNRYSTALPGEPPFSSHQRIHLQVDALESNGVNFLFFSSRKIPLTFKCRNSSQICKIINITLIINKCAFSNILSIAI